MRMIHISPIMRRFPHSLTSVRTLYQVPVRLRSTATEVRDISAKTPLKPAGWESARPYKEIPGPKPLPIVGNVWRFMPFIGEFHNAQVPDFFNIMHGKYGPVAKMSGLPGKPEFVLLADPDEIANVFRNEGPWPIRQPSESLQYYYENYRKDYPVSLATSNGKEWQDFRTAVNQVMMQPRNTKQYVEPIDRVSQEFIDRMRAIRNDDWEMPANFTDEIAKWSLESITYVALDARLGILQNLQPDSEGARMIDAVHRVFDSMFKLDFLPSPWKVVSTPAYRQLVKSMDCFTEVAAKYVHLAMERLKNVPSSELENRSYSVLESLLLRTQDPQRAITMALDMLLAGIDTTATVVATVMYQLAIHPDKQQKLQEELDRVIQDPSKALTKDQLEELRYLRACVKETMRVMPIIIGNSRTTVKDMVIGGYQVPAGTMTTTSAKRMLEDDMYFPRANEFLPERWLPGAEDLKCKNLFTFLPFGFGPRMCVGRRFADLEIETLVAKTFRNFTLEWNRPPPKDSYEIIFRFVDPLSFTVKDRM